MQSHQTQLALDDPTPRTTKGMSAVIKESPLYQTEGIRYSGSKRTIIPFIHEAIKGLNIQTALDGFSGSTRVGQFFKKAGFSVQSNDLAVYSEVFGTAYLVNNDAKPQGLQAKLDHLNNLAGVEGFFTQAYGGEDDGAGKVKSADGKKKPFMLHNTRKLDAIRPEIDVIAANPAEKAILLTSLILALDKVENTLGHQVAYLSDWAPRSYEKMRLEMPTLLNGNGVCTVSRQDVATIQAPFDLAYFDPPYNTNNPVTVTTRVRYASYYHIWTTIVKNDQPKLVGKSNRREDSSSDSIPGVITPYESTKLDVVEKEFQRLVEGINAQYVLLSYSNKGKVPPDRLMEILSAYGAVTVTRMDHKENVQKTLTINQQWLGDQTQNFEYLFLLRKV